MHQTIEPVLESPWAAATEAHSPRAYTPQEEKLLQWEAQATKEV